MKKQNLYAFGAMIVGIISGCRTIDHCSEPGIQPQEETVLVSAYYWRRGIDPSSFSDKDIHILFTRSMETAFDDGERSEGQASTLILALASAGDQRFSSLLSREVPEVREATLKHMRSLWTHPNLCYPQTQALARK
jgi:hypothetical protein